ncbi:nitronate monooxygenase [Pseudomonas sp. S75]|uniref:NAD(P)H-dependent flavin oxidoreductase n=1 Tax=unclassified Pseudomonas TaxID=196821 RepID=UPI001905E979|nr:MULTISPECIES: nitronate monooxygenase [unclassified Pseudomonas]MBJ9976548.1 nitronate monooxygenase [Pseudomonas sp. S30]MBK0154364.1 nitronate monooxygenase [Pseudomonas sp. S75]
MNTWPDRRILDLLNIQLPILQAPMAGAGGSALAIAVGNAGGLGALPCAMLGAEQIAEEVAAFRTACQAPLNLNFFCHAALPRDAAREERWRQALKPYYDEVGADFQAPTPVSSRAPFDEQTCQLVERLRPQVVSFHFGLPEAGLLGRVKATGARILSSATTVEEAVWLEQRGCDAIIAMGYEAGGHRAMFLSEDLTTQIGTFALVPQVVDAVSVPVIAAGGIGDARGLSAALALGASAVQIGTAYLFTPQAKVSAFHRQALDTAAASQTALTNLFTGRPARGILNRVMRELGPVSDLAPHFPLAGGALMPLRAITEAQHRDDFSNLWAGQALRLGQRRDAGELTRDIALGALRR